MNTKISIVIVSRNEENGIVKCIKAAQEAAVELGGAEVLLCDSASTDKTVEIANSLGIKVLSLKPEWTLSASAGRFIGTHYSNTEYILFLDADTLIYKGFLPHALDFMEKNPKTAGLTGFIDDLDAHGIILQGIEKRSDEVRNIEWMRGPCCLYRRSALIEVGSFNPYLTSEEEAELGFRLIKNNWEIAAIPFKMALHTRCEENYDFQSLMSHTVRSFYSGRLGGITNTIFCAFRGGYGLAFCNSRLKTTIIFLLWILIAGLSLLLPPSLHPKIIFSFQIAAGFSALWIKKGELSSVFVFISDKILMLMNIVWGVSKIHLKDSKNYPVSVDIS